MQVSLMQCRVQWPYPRQSSMAKALLCPVMTLVLERVGILKFVVVV